MNAVPMPLPAHDPLAAPPPALALRLDELEAWLAAAAPGARVEYHRGFLPLDRARGSSPFGDKRRRELIAIAERLMALADSGEVHLVQRRYGCRDYGYLAVKAAPAPKRRSRR